MLIIDEAQDILKDTHINFKRKYKKVSYSADNNQILYPDKQTTEQELNQIYKNRTFTLSQNFRNSYEILEFVKNIFPNHGINNNLIEYAKYNRQIGQKPILFYSNNQNDLIKLLKKLGNTKSIAILVPTVKLFYEYIIILDTCNVAYSAYNHKQHGDIRNNIFSKIHLTTFKSSKGLEFDIVIMPNFENFNFFRYNGNVVTENDYYVGMTRAKEQLFPII